MAKPTTQPRLPSKDDMAQLDHFSSLLHLLHHRNQNQHRRSPWYRHFSLFRRHLSALLADYTTLSTTPTTAVERTRLKALTPGLQTRISQRLKFWQDVLVARWLRAFSQVVADGRFSVLGLVMLGVLGGVCKVVGIVDGLEAEGQAEIERVLEEFGREAWGGSGTEGLGEKVTRAAGDSGKAVARVDEGEVFARGDDEGEVVARQVEDEDDEAMDAMPEPTGNGTPTATTMNKHRVQDDDSEDDEPSKTKATRKPSPSPPKVAKTKSSSTKKRSADPKSKPAKKKRKKGGDAIDDLFSGW